MPDTHLSSQNPRLCRKPPIAPACSFQNARRCCPCCLSAVVLRRAAALQAAAVRQGMRQRAAASPPAGERTCLKVSLPAASRLSYTAGMPRVEMVLLMGPVMHSTDSWKARSSLRSPPPPPCLRFVTSNRDSVRHCQAICLYQPERRAARSEVPVVPQVLRAHGAERPCGGLGAHLMPCRTYLLQRPSTMPCTPPSRMHRSP